MRSLFKLTSILILFPVAVLAARSRGGAIDIGGGDFIRADFLNRGQAVISYLKQTPTGKKITTENNLNPSQLEDLLNVNVIKVVDTILIDRTGSIVDALGETGKITLNKNSWSQFYQEDLDTYFMVFHELLRAQGINDDNYVISKKIFPMPEAFTVTNILTAKKNLLTDDSLAAAISNERIIFGGSGCPDSSIRTMARFDFNNNVFNIYPHEMNVSVGSSIEKVKRSSCSIAIPYTAKIGTKIIISQIDLNGELNLSPQKLLDISFSAFIPGQTEELQKRQFQTALSDNKDGAFLIRENKIIESSCGGTGILRLNSSLILQDQNTKILSQTSYAKINKISLFLKTEKCK